MKEETFPSSYSTWPCLVVLWSVALFTEHGLQFSELEPASNPAAGLPSSLPMTPTNSCVEVLMDLSMGILMYLWACYRSWGSEISFVVLVQHQATSHLLHVARV